MTVLEDRLSDFQRIHLQSGGHGSFEDGVCAMEAAAWLAGEPHSASPKCVSAVITAFLVNWNDNLHSVDDRDRLLKPLIPLTIGTRTTKKDEETRAWMATDWLVREQAPAWLRLAGLTDHAVLLEQLVPLAGAAAARKVQPTIEDARRAGAAAGAAAGSPAWAAAGSAARDAAWAAAGSAARDAAWDALQPTVDALQTSAALLVKRMCDVGRTPSPGNSPGKHTTGEATA